MACLASCPVCNQFYNVRTDVVCPNCTLDDKLKYSADPCYRKVIEPRKYAPIMSLYWYKELESSRPTLYNTFLTEDEALDMCKGYHTYGRVSGIGGLL